MSILCAHVIIVQCLLNFGIGKAFAEEYMYEGWCNQNFSVFTELSGEDDAYKFVLFDKTTHGEKPIHWDSDNIILEVSKNINFCHVFRGTRSDMDGNKESVLRIFLKSQTPSFQLLVTNGHQRTLGRFKNSKAGCWVSFPVHFNYAELKKEPPKICVEFHAYPKGAPFLTFVDHISVTNNVSAKYLSTTLGLSTTWAPPSTTPRMAGLTTQSVNLLMMIGLALLLFSIAYALMIAITICI